MAGENSTPSARQSELLELAYQYALQHGLTDLSLRPLATAIGSSPGVLLFLFGSKDGLIRALLGRARADELVLLDQLHDATDDASGGLAAVTERAGFAETTVEDWLNVLATAQPITDRDTITGRAQRTLVLAILRGALLDLLATGDIERTTAAVHHQLDSQRPALH